MQLLDLTKVPYIGLTKQGHDFISMGHVPDLSDEEGWAMAMDKFCCDFASAPCFIAKLNKDKHWQLVIGGVLTVIAVGHGTN